MHVRGVLYESISNINVSTSGSYSECLPMIRKKWKGKCWYINMQMESMKDQSHCTTIPLIINHIATKNKVTVIVRIVVNYRLPYVGIDML